jgi:hypothetical protein
LGWLHQSFFIIEKVACIKSSELLKIILQNTQTLQLFTKIIKQKAFRKVIDLPSRTAWVEKPAGLIKRGRKRKRFSERLP